MLYFGNLVSWDTGRSSLAWVWKDTEGVNSVDTSLANRWHVRIVLGFLIGNGSSTGQLAITKCRHATPRRSALSCRWLVYIEPPRDKKSSLSGVIKLIYVVVLKSVWMIKACPRSVSLICLMDGRTGCREAKKTLVTSLSFWDSSLKLGRGGETFHVRKATIL